ncbi:MAG: RagB/SusD family nutrient uptake outer membrane protein, partial [Bacteroidota bacterium]|nr:RagB/SusD family nutrient uptake outer membrane protein [Bacteroidota bacterium]
VRDPDKLGPFLSRQQSIDAIMNLLNEAYTDLKNSTISFPFTTSLALSTPTQLNISTSVAEFAKINRALAARVAVYRQDWATASTALSESFLSLNGDLNTGVYHRYSIAGGDELNPLFIPANSPAAENRLTHPSFITEASPNDNRVSSKVALRNSPGFQDGLQSSYDFLLYKSNTAPIPIIRNEELILLYAEVKAQTNMFTDAVNAINTIRNAAGIGNYGGAQTMAALITEILRQRRYSLFGEGHRWIDLRRYNRLNELPKDRGNDDVWSQFPQPANE